MSVEQSDRLEPSRADANEGSETDYPGPEVMPLAIVRNARVA